MCKEKRSHLEAILKEYAKEDICLAFSGGIDSSLILKIACEYAKVFGTKVYAVTFDTKLHPKSDVEIARKVAAECGAEHVVLSMDETRNQEVLKNPVDRCYHCKKYLFSYLIEWANQRGIFTVMEGSNADDSKTYRPGLLAVKELGIKSPLLMAALLKTEIREIARSLNLSVSNRPSAPCMATRIPYNTPLDFSILEKLEEGEVYLKEQGFAIVRLRYHNPVLRIEVESTDFSRLLNMREQILSKMKALGFVYVTLDLEGFRSGSMDVGINEEKDNER